MSAIGRAILTAAAMRAAERRVIDRGTSVDALLQRAGEGAAEAAWRFAGNLPTLVLCGPGNNGGDGYVIARVLAERGVAVRVAASAAPATPAASAARRAWPGPVLAIDDAAPAPLMIDCLFGTGLSRGLAPALADRLARLADTARLRIAIDLPSGVDSDGGMLLSAVPRFDLTVALGALKPAHLLQPAAERCGRIALVDIGLGTIESDLREIARPAPAPPGIADHKYSRGFVAVIGGAMPGAALLAAGAAQRAGAGYVLLAGEGAGGAASLVRRAAADAGLLDDRRIGTVVIGPGLGRDRPAREALGLALASGRPLVIDADALTLLGAGGLFRLARQAELPILTPHEGEFARLFGDLPGSRIDRARAAARAARAVVLLKGSDSVVAHPDGRAAIAPPAPAWLASAGTGDVLAGIIAAMRARGLDPFAAACAGVWLHGAAARAAGPGLIADDLIDALKGLA